MLFVAVLSPGIVSDYLGMAGQDLSKSVPQDAVICDVSASIRSLGYYLQPIVGRDRMNEVARAKYLRLIESETGNAVDRVFLQGLASAVCQGAVRRTRQKTKKYGLDLCQNRAEPQDLVIRMSDHKNGVTQRDFIGA